MEDNVNDPYVYVRKNGKVYYTNNYPNCCYRIRLSEALERGYKQSKMTYGNNH